MINIYFVKVLLAKKLNGRSVWLPNCLQILINFSAVFNIHLCNNSLFRSSQFEIHFQD